MFKKNSLLISALIALIAISTLLTYIRIRSGHTFYGDTAQLYLILEHLYQGIGAFNPVQPSLIDFQMITKMGNMEPADICRADFSAGPYTADQYNHFKFHAYFILLPISLLLKFISVQSVVVGFHFFAFISFLLISGYILYKRNISYINIFFISLVITLHPAWSWAFQGQPYVDRLYLPFGLLIAYFISIQKRSISIAYLFVFISSFIVEKVLIYNAIFLISYSIIFYSNDKKNIAFSRAFVGFLSLIFFIIISKFYIQNSYYTSAVPFSLQALLNNLLWPDAINGSITLLIISLPLLIPSLIWNKRLFLVAFITILPNIFGNIGGAEKVGFYTHYHTLYFPFLVFSFIYSLPVDSFGRIKNSIRTLIFFMIPFYLFLNIDEHKNIYFSRKIENNYLVKIVDEVRRHRPKGTEYETVAKNIPLDSKVTAIESGMPYVYEVLDLHFYPLNLGNSEFLILNYASKDGKYSYHGYFGYRGQQHITEVDKCMSPVIEKFYDTEHPILLNDQLAILKRR